VCLHGRCARECAEYNGCSTGFIRCPSGECARDISVCKGNCTEGLYVCGDKSCNLPDNCTVLLRFEAAIPFTQHISPLKNSTLGVLSTSGIPIVALDLPAGTFKNTTSINVSAVSFSSLKNVQLPKYWGNETDLESNIFSSAVAFDVPPKATPFEKNITVTFNGNIPENFNLSELCLGYINKSGLWDCASELEFMNGTFIGITSHFTSYAVIKRVGPPKFNSISRNDLDVFSHLNVNSVIIYVYCGLVIIFSVLFAWAFHRDKEEKRQKRRERILRNKEYEYEEEPRTPPVARKSISLFRPETPPTPAGVISPSPLSPPPSRTSDAPLLNASTASTAPPATPSLSSPSPVSPYPPVSPSPTNNTFRDGEMSVESGKGEQQQERERERERRPRARTVVMKEAAQARFTMKHKWLSIYFTARIENLPRVARVTILLCMILTNMTVAAALFNAENRRSIEQRILVGVISSLISFACSFAIFIMFKLTRKRYRPICYVVSAIWVLGTGFLTMLYNLKLEQSAAYGWCISSAIGIGQDALINEPVKILVIALLIAFCPCVPFVNKL
jgi:hypothetical protein